ncbi:MAG: ACT domain-containing protein [Pseudomonadota bacterium]
MTRLFKAKELNVVADNKPGTLARVTAPIAEARVNINAFCAYTEGNKAHFLIITDDNAKAIENLKKADLEISEREVVVVETSNEAGTLFRSAQQLAKAGVDLDYCYATAGAQGSTWIVFATKAIEKAMNVIP